MTKDPIALAWAAGLFEAKGSIVVQLDAQHWPELQLSLLLADPEPLERWQDLVDAGKIYGPIARSKVRPVYQWRASGFKLARQIFEAIREHLSFRLTRDFELALLNECEPDDDPRQQRLFDDAQDQPES